MNYDPTAATNTPYVLHHFQHWPRLSIGGIIDDPNGEYSHRPVVEMVTGGFGGGLFYYFSDLAITGQQ